MTKLQLLNAYLTERLTVVVKEILDVVEDTVTEYREETARTKRENESLRRQLRDILLLEAETEWLRSTRSSLGFAAPEQQTSDAEPRPCSEEPDSTLNQTRQPPANQKLEQVVSVQSETPLPGDQKPAESWESGLKPELQQEAFRKASPLPSLSTLSTSSAAPPKIHIEVPALREEPRAPAPPPPRIKTEPEEYNVCEPEAHAESVTASTHAHVPLLPPEESTFRAEAERAAAAALNVDRHERNKKSSQETSDDGAVAVLQETFADLKAFVMMDAVNFNVSSVSGRDALQETEEKDEWR
ncbi:zinc finger protein 628-like [Scomber scombrus]|uniref:Zinc finger protein 628-like n=1 Tax=Scomber scombrus TaxID=13677 RepID=A0AAV1Q7V0_SCOSC